jgi:hypothetical protein
MAPIEFDYSTPEAEGSLRGVIDEGLVIREQLSDPSLARKVGAYDRVYEWSLGLAVIPVLIGRFVTRVVRGPSTNAPSDPTGLVAEIRRELRVGGGERKIRLYERSLGLAVIPVLVRRGLYKVYYAVRRLPG